MHFFFAKVGIAALFLELPILACQRLLSLLQHANPSHSSKNSDVIDIDKNDASKAALAHAESLAVAEVRAATAFFAFSFASFSFPPPGHQKSVGTPFFFATRTLPNFFFSLATFADSLRIGHHDGRSFEAPRRNQGLHAQLRLLLDVRGLLRARPRNGHLRPWH